MLELETINRQTTSVIPVPLWIDSAIRSATPQPITVGVPFPQAQLSDPGELSLLDAEDRPVPLQKATLARWPDGSVKWVLLDFLLSRCREGREQWRLVYEQFTRPAVQAHVNTVGERDDAIHVDTGPCRFDIDRNVFRPFTAVHCGDLGSPRAFTSQTILTDRKARAIAPIIETICVEGAGPVRTTLCFEGRFPNCTGIRFRARLCFFAGTGLVRLRFTLHNARRARHRGGLWDLGDSGSFYFRDLSIVSSGDQPPTAILWKPELDEPLRELNGGKLEVYQDSSGGPNWQSRNHVNWQGRVPCRFRGYRVRTPGQEFLGLRASPVVCAQHGHASLSVCVPEFWQQFPKAIEVDGADCIVRLFPCHWDDLFELQGGEQKTHTIWLCFGRESKATAEALDWSFRPARAHAAPDWYAATGAIAHFLPAEADPDGRLKSLLAEVTDGQRSFTSRRDLIDEYGWRNFGEIYADHEAAYYSGPTPVVSHYNNQYDMVYGFLVHFLRTGDPRWFDLCDSLARHVIDIDIYHTDRDKAAYNGGLFWFTDHYKDAATCTHRTYSRSNCQQSDRSYGGGPGSEHNFTAGLTYYYFLSGDPAARDAAIGLADWVINMEDGTKNLLGLLDDGPTGLAGHVHNGPGRGVGNSIQALLDAWLLTEERRYLDWAERLVRRAAHPLDDVDGRNLLDVEKRWSYTVFLSALARYLDVKAELAELDQMYAYGRASLLTYARWMLANEVPYFDHAERLEFPTEAWAAQEFRKANVLRLAARHADAALRSQLFERGAELADRAWHDLLRFESRTVARAIAIVMVEGLRDRWLRLHGTEEAPSPAVQCDFGSPEVFLSQRRRILRQLGNPRGFASLVARLLKPLNWKTVLLPSDSDRTKVRSRAAQVALLKNPSIGESTR